MKLQIKNYLKKFFSKIDYQHRLKNFIKSFGNIYIISHFNKMMDKSQFHQFVWKEFRLLLINRRKFLGKYFKQKNHKRKYLQPKNKSKNSQFILFDNRMD